MIVTSDTKMLTEFRYNFITYFFLKRKRNHQKTIFCIEKKNLLNFDLKNHLQSKRILISSFYSFYNPPPPTIIFLLSKFITKFHFKIMKVHISN